MSDAANKILAHLSRPDSPAPKMSSPKDLLRGVVNRAIEGAAEEGELGAIRAGDGRFAIRRLEFDGKPIVELVVSRHGEVVNRLRFRPATCIAVACLLQLAGEKLKGAT